MKIKTWLLGAIAGGAVGVAVASTMTFLDWRLNPGGIFHDAENTHWGVVWDTAISWFLPVGGIATALALLILLVLERRT